MPTDYDRALEAARKDARDLSHRLFRLGERVHHVHPQPCWARGETLVVVGIVGNPPRRYVLRGVDWDKSEDTEQVSIRYGNERLRSIEPRHVKGSTCFDDLTPPFRGGQGRTDEEPSAAGWRIEVAIMAAVFCLLAWGLYEALRALSEALA